MSDTPRPPATRIGTLTFHEVWSALKAGLWDFRTAPLFGLFFSAFYVVAGLALWWVGAGTFLWTLAFALGFPLVAPFAAVGLYEVSRRIEADEPLSWPGVLGVVWAERGRQLPWMGAILAMIFLFWSFFAHMAVALALGPSSLSGDPLAVMMASQTGRVMMVLQVVVGGAVAFLTFGLTVLSLPHLVDREVDFVTAMLTSLRAVAANRGPMILWAAIVAVLLLAAMLPLFLGLFVVLPVLGHATWHLYRRVLYAPD